MMFDIEEKMEAIPDPKTRKLFGEVYSSYQHGNYRSAVVMLWSVVISDMIFKLEFLDNTYRNKKALSVLDYIKKKQDERPESSEWEKELLKKAYEELKFITLNDKTNLEHLRSQRNLSAHPVLTEDNLLVTPNKDTTRSLIRNAMEAILLKTPLLHRELVDSVVAELASNKERLGSYENVKPYIQKRYFPNISEEGAKKYSELCGVLYLIQEIQMNKITDKLIFLHYWLFQKNTRICMQVKYRTAPLIIKCHLNLLTW